MKIAAPDSNGAERKKMCITIWAVVRPAAKSAKCRYDLGPDHPQTHNRSLRAVNRSTSDQESPATVGIG